MKIKIFSELDDKLTKDWRKLWKRSLNAHPFNSPEWFLSALKAYGYGEILIISCFDGDKCLGILPLVKTKKKFAKTWMSPGGNYLDRSSMLVLDNNIKVINKIMGELLSYKSFYLTEVSQAAKDIAVRYKPMINFSESSVNPFLMLRPDPLRFLSHKHRKQINKILDENPGKLELVSYVGINREILDLMVKIELESNKQGNFKDIFSDPVLSGLISFLDQEKSGSVVVNVLYFEGQPICFKYGYIFKNLYHSGNTAFKQAYGYLIPGRVITYLMLQFFYQIGIKTFDFSRGDSQLKREFTEHSYQQYSLYYSSNFFINYFWRLTDWVFHFLESHPKLFDKVRIAKNILTRGLPRKLNQILPKKSGLAGVWSNRKEYSGV